ncbi:cytochrome P450 3A16-like [Ixodes scapularis]|uniref:cytochrome P450 3A16-like n=1 Tax=Ixodes scapularis TaxID=6945 RepID=UPI001A9DE806|nr:cytochrome P450 3A16-like [Ixodes scapularis]
MASTAYLLAKHQDVQERLRKKIKRALINDDASAKDILKVEYLDQVISEALRIYPPLSGFISRTCKEDYDYNGLTIPAGISVIIPASSLHRDPELWSEPKKFDPERFSSDNKGSLNPITYQAFGNGPRSCMGMRFGQTALKLALGKILAKYKLHLDDRHLKEDELPLSNSLIFSAPRDGVWLKLEKVES